MASVSSGHVGRAVVAVRPGPAHLKRATSVSPSDERQCCAIPTAVADLLGLTRYTSLPHRKFLCELCREPHAPL